MTTPPETIIPLVAATRSALPLAQRLLAAWPDARLEITPRLAEDAARMGLPHHVMTRPLGEELAERFHHHRRWVFFLATGAVVRMLAPLLQSKFTDPAVVVMDGAGRFAIPLLSGHLGGANALAEEAAVILGATAVITTASDVQGTLAVDLLGRGLGWRVEADPETLRRAAACVVNGEPVALIQECGSSAWRASLEPLPANLHLIPRPTPMAMTGMAALLWITRRTREEVEALGFDGPTVLYRPPPEGMLILGIGCDRDTALETIAQGVQRALEGHGLNVSQVAGVATIDRKGDEPGLLAYVHQQGWSLTIFSADELASMSVPNPSEMVQRWVGVPSVAEAAALRATGGDLARLVVVKQVFKGGDGRHVTVAAARVAGG